MTLPSRPSRWAEIPASLLGRRGRTILATASWSLMAKLAAAANLFLAVPFVLQALGPQQFGAWATLTSLVYLAGFLDFGFGNGAMNLVAAAHGRNELHEVASICRAAARALLAIAIGLLLAGACLAPLLPWYRALGLPPEDAATARQAATSVMISVALAVPLNLAMRVQLGLGRGERAFRWQAGGQLLALAATIAAARAGSALPLITAATVATPLLASLGNTLQLRRELSGSAAPIDTSALARRIRHEGFLFFVMQLAAALAFSADLPLIAALRGSAEAGQFAIAQRPFLLVPLCLGLIWAPLWPIYRQALAAGDHAWVKRTLRRSILFAFGLAAVAGSIIACAFRPLLTLWTGHAPALEFALVAGLAAWCVLEAVGTAIATFLNAASIIRYQVVVAAVFAPACFGAKLLALRHHGIEWVPWITTTAYLLLVLAPAAVKLPSLVRGALERSY